MMSKYDPSAVEPKWQQRWEEAGVYRVDLTKAKKPHYCLVMFPYPSGARLHVGHWFQYGPTDSYARFLKMRGHDVFFPMGFDAFGLPAENYAIKTGVPPAESTAENVRNMIEQFRRMGCMYDWSKSLNTSDPSYYRWTQWLFLQMFQHKLAYRKEAPVNFCPQCQTVLAREQCQDGTCERCETQVIQRPLTQWFWKIRDYADRLLDGLDGLDWPEKTKTMQRNWIGRSEGAVIKFEIRPFETPRQCHGEEITAKRRSSRTITGGAPQGDTSIEIFTTRPDTLFGVTYIVLAPEHPLVANITTKAQRKHIEAYVKEVKTKNELQRTDLAKEKTGVFTGSYALHPATGERIPIWIADYVLMTYGTGAVMAVPAHDERDWEFARKYKLPLQEVVSGGDITKAAFVADGITVNSDFLNSFPTPAAKKRITAWLEDEEKGREVTTYRLHDWLVSRQRYWGAPIPIVYDPDGHPHPIPEKHLPWLLPTDVEFKPTGESPLRHSKEFKERTENIFGKGWEPEYDTMDTFVCSSFYYLRFLAQQRDGFETGNRCHCPPYHDTLLIDPSIERKWLPIQTYIGGPEHACMHLIYARFVMMALKDFGIVSHEEPFKKLVHQGLITNKGAKMSKSKGNVVDPDPLVARYGSDVFRMYLMFMGPYTDGGDWSETGIKGIERFVQRIWGLVSSLSLVERARERGSENSAVLTALHKTIKRVTEDMEQLHFNTAISSLMEFLNVLEEQEHVSRETLKTFAILLAPLAPHLAEELWEQLQGGADRVMVRDSERSEESSRPITGFPSFIFHQPWPHYDPQLLVSRTMTIVVQVNGRVRANIDLPADFSKEEVIAAAKRQENVAKYLGNAKTKKEVYVPGKLVNFVL